jgi:uncharacterized membrane protein
MTKEDLDKINEDKTKNRFKSRTFWLTILWTAFVPISIIVQLFVKEIELPTASIVTLAGTIALMYIGGNKATNIANTMKLDK